MKKAYKIIVKGNVQGVFFRRFVKETADNLELKGYVRNMPDSTVEIFVEGQKNSIAEFIEQIKKGSKYSQVKDVSVAEKTYSGQFEEFKILRF